MVGWPDAGERTELREYAEQWQGAYLAWAQRAQHKPLRVPIATVGEAIDAFLAERQHILEPLTLSGYRVALNHLIEMYGLTGNITKVIPQDVIGHLLRSGKKPSTVRSYSIALSALWAWMDLPYEVTLPKAVQTDVRVWHDLEVKRIQDAAMMLGMTHRIAVDLGLFMGLRRGEIFGLAWEDIHEDRTVRVRWQIPQRSEERKHLKGKKNRTALILPGWTHEGGEGFVVGRLTSRYDQRRMIIEVLRGAGLSAPGIGWHSLRHTYSRMFLEAGGTLEQLKIFLGHSTIRRSEETYGHYHPNVATESARTKIYGS